MQFKVKRLYLALFGAISCLAQAQEKTMADVVVSGNAMAPQADTDLAARKAANADSASLLLNLPGVALQGAGGISSLPVVHGLADDRVKIQVDGMELIAACANHMNPPLSYIDPSRVDSIKLLAGISPVSQGGDSLAGTIQVASAPPRFAAPGEAPLFKGELGSFLRSNGHAKGAHLAASLASDSLSLNFNGAAAEAGNYKAGGNFKAAGLSTGTLTKAYLGGDEVGSSAYKTENESLNLAWRNANHLLEVTFGRQHLPFQAFPNQRMDMTANNSHQTNLHYLGRFDWGNLDARIYHEKTRHKMNFLEDKATSLLGMPMDTDGDNRSATVKADIQLNPRDSLRIGGEYQRYRLHDWWDPIAATVGMMAPNTFWNIRDGQRDRFDVYGEWEARWTPQWLTNVGLRSATVTMDSGKIQGYNNATSGMGAYGDPNNPASIPGAFNGAERGKTDHNIDLTALARFTPSAQAEYEFGYAMKTRSPNLYERFAWSNQNTMVMNMINWSGDANGYVGNLNLKPEIAHTLSATASWHDANQENWQVQLAPFYTQVQNYIDAARCPVVAGSACTAANLAATTGFVYLQFQNQSARLQGLDLSGYVSLGKLADLGRFSVTGLVNYVQGKNRSTGDNLYNIMPLNAKLALVQQSGAWSNTLESQLVDAKTRVSAVRNELKTGGYGLLNLRSSYDGKQARLDFSIENLLNKNYALPLGGAYVGQRTMVYGTPVAGPGRSVNVGVTVKF